MPAFLKKLDYVHVLLILAFVATVAVPDVVNLENALGLGSAVALTLKVGTYLSGLLMLLKQFAPAPASVDTIQAQASKLRSLGAIVMVMALGAMMLGCMSSAPVVPVTPQNAQQVSSCESSASVHNDAAITSIALGAVGTGLGSVAAVDQDPNARAGLAIGGAASAALAGGAAAIVALAAQNFQNGHCTDVVGALPAKPASQARLLPRLSEIDETTVTVDRVSQ